MKPKILVALSGRADSAVTAALLKNQGFEVIGLYLQFSDASPNAKGLPFKSRCARAADPAPVKRLCEKLDIQFIPVSARDRFEGQVVDDFVHEILQQRLPNPCALCNREVKFHHLFEKADELGCEKVATGHYAQVIPDPIHGTVRLTRASDLSRDQSYFLYSLTQRELARLTMPLGGIPRSMVRKLAAVFELPLDEEVDSPSLCFVSDAGCKAFVESRSAPSLRPSGIIRTFTGETIGEHEGLHGYSLGSRRGLHLSGKESEHYCVVGFDSRQNVLIVGPEEVLRRTRLRATRVNWIAPLDGLKDLRCKSRIHSQGEEAACYVTPFENGAVHVEFDEPQRLIIPGQTVVFYDGDEGLGCAVIEAADPAAMESQGA